MREGLTVWHHLSLTGGIRRMNDPWMLLHITKRWLLQYRVSIRHSYWTHITQYLIRHNNHLTWPMAFTFWPQHDSTLNKISERLCKRDISYGVKVRVLRDLDLRCLPCCRKVVKEFSCGRHNSHIWCDSECFRFVRGAVHLLCLMMSYIVHVVAFNNDEIHLLFIGLFMVIQLSGLVGVCA